MPRRRRFQPDYSHLLGVSLDTVLDAAIRRRGYGRDRRKYPAEANAAVLRLYGDRTWLSRADLRAGADVARGPRGWSPEFALDHIGNLIGWGMHLSLVEEAPGPGPGGEAGYRLIEREQVFEVIAGKAVRVCGLPDAEQIAMTVRVSRLRRLRETLDRKRDAAVGETASHLVDRLIASTPDALIPAALTPFLGRFLADLPTASCSGTRACSSRRRTRAGTRIQARWLEALNAAAVDAGAAFRRAEEERAAASLAEDAAAFAEL